MILSMQLVELLKRKYHSSIAPSPTRSRRSRFGYGFHQLRPGNNGPQFSLVYCYQLEYRPIFLGEDSYLLLPLTMLVYGLLDNDVATVLR